MSGGKGGGSTIVGYRYYAGIHMVLCAGPIDSISEIIVGEKSAWTGNADSSQQITIDAPELFGGDDREGGIVGKVDVMMGEATQAKNTYLTGLLGSVIPAFRGVCSLVLRRPQLSAMNPYIKPWSARATRIHTAPDGSTQWYDDKAAIFPESTAASAIASDATWDFQVTDQESDPGNSNLTPPSSGWTSAPAPFGHSTSGAGPYATDWPLYDTIWIRRSITVPGGQFLKLALSVENGCVVMVDGAVVASVNRDNEQPPPTYDGSLTIGPFGATRTVELVIKGFDEANAGSTDTFLKISGEFFRAADMNPAHIIRECLVNTVWGKGYSTDDIDDDAFKAAADTLYTENFGISIFWEDDRQTIDQFIQLILQHIDASLYADQTTGKFVLKLTRDDYDLDDLITLDDSNITSVESFTRPSPDELINQITVTYHDGASDQDMPVTVQDIAALDAAGGAVRENKITYEGISNAALATRVAMRELGEVSRPLAKATLISNRAAATLNIGSVFKWSNAELGISNLVMRVANIGYGTLTAGAMRIECVEDVFALPSAVYLAPQSTSWSDPRTKPVDAAHKVIGEIPYWTIIKQLTGESTSAYGDIDDDAGFLSAAALRPSSDSLNAGVWTRQGTADYAQAGNMPFCPGGTISAALDLDDTAITVENAEDLDTVATGTYAQIDDELVAVKTVDDATGEITVDRGVLDTVPATHDAGARIYFLERFQFIGTEQYIDEAVDVKLLPKTGLGTLALADAATKSYTFANRQIRPYPPGNVTLNGDAYPATITGALTVAWSHRDRLLQTASLIPQSEGDIGPETGTTYTLKLYNENGDLVRTEDALTDTSYAWSDADEKADSGLEVDDDDWTPANLVAPPDLWLNDKSDITDDGSGNCSQWNDISGNGWHATQSNASMRPTIIADAQNGLRAIKFDGSTQGLTLPIAAHGIFRAVDAAWIMAIYRPGEADAGNVERPIMVAATNVRSYRAGIDNGSTVDGWGNKPSGGGRRLDSDSFAGVASDTSRSEEWVMSMLVMDYSERTITLYVNGAQDAQATEQFAGAGATSDTDSISVSVGYTFDASHPISFFRGEIAEILAGATIPSSDEIDNLFGYAAWKLGLDSLLPSTHPYKDSPPGGIITYRPNGKIRLTLESVRDGYDSWQSHDITVKRQGYGFNYGESYGDN